MRLNPNAKVAHKFRNGFKLTEHPQHLSDPVLRGKPKRIFLNSLSDTFHKDVSDGFLDATFDMITQYPQHIFQVLTKRPEGFSRIQTWPRNVWLGVTMESEKYLSRLEILKKQDAAVRFASLEPLLGPIPVDAIKGLDWLIVGGESGPKARPMDLKWAIEIREACRRYGVPLWFKQVGGKDRQKGGSLLEGKEHHEYPIL
jgi:protein gp37